MAAAFLLSGFLSVTASQAPPAGSPVFQPRFAVRLQPPPPESPRRTARRDGDRDIVCGMVMIRKTPHDDPKIILPARETGAAVRRIEPDVCRSNRVETPK